MYSNLNSISKIECACVVAFKFNSIFIKMNKSFVQLKTDSILNVPFQMYASDEFIFEVQNFCKWSNI